MVATALTLEVRDYAFPIDDVPPAWHGGRRAITTFFDNLSTFFPAGERFFVVSVKAHRDVVTDPRLQRDVKAFCAQEGCHRREHARYNRMLARHGRPTEKLEQGVEKLLARVSKIAPKRWQLAATCALEHFTALLARAVLTDDRVLEGAHPAMADLWRWHALEEDEHRAVAFDVYLAAGGNTVERGAVMLLATVVFWAKVAEHQVVLMRADGTLRSIKEWREMLSFLFLRPGTLTKLLPPYLAYFSPRFHPARR
jgi:hypothetical protein